MSSSSLPNAIATTEDFEFAALAEAKNYRETLVREFRQFINGDVIEIGAGIGQVTELLGKLPGVSRLLAVEPDPGFLEKHLTLFPHHDVLPGTIDEVEQGSAWNAIVSVNVLEHIERDAEELKKYRTLLADRSGHLCLFVPARPEIYAPIDKDFGHFRRYTRGELRQKMEQAGFEVVRLEYFNAVGYLAWWLNFCVLRKRHFEIGKVMAYDRLIFPVVHWWESRIMRPFLGQSLLVVGRAR